jgi:hypothetical protein
MSSSTFYLVREFLSNFIEGQTASPEGSALNVVQNCLTNLQHYKVENSEIQSQEQLKIVLHLGHHMELPEFAQIPAITEDELLDQKDPILGVLTTVCNSDFSLLRVRFLLAVRSCIYYNIMKSSIADILFLFCMSLSRSEQMTQASWERRWNSHE